MPPLRRKMMESWGLVKEKARILMSSTNTGLKEGRHVEEQPEEQL